MQGTACREGVGRLIGAARRRMKQLAWGRLAPYKLTPQQFWIILELRNQDGLSLHDLAERIWVDDPTACRILTKLCQQKVVRTGSDPGDRRRFRLGLTAKGRKLGEELAQLARDLHAGFVRGLSTRE